MQTFKKFIIKELVFTSSIAIIAYILFQTKLSEDYLPVFWLLLGLIAVLTGTMHFSLLLISDKNAAKFSIKFMTFSGVKMMIYLVTITSYVFLYSASAKFFLISFFILYFLYTAFEVFQIVKYLKANKSHK
jgi:hypothetical protein